MSSRSLTSSTSTKITCQENGQWSMPVDHNTCAAVTCAAPSLDNGLAECSGTGEHHWCSFACNKGFMLDYNSTGPASLPFDHLPVIEPSVCKAGGEWHPPVPQCVPVQCEPIAQPDNAVLNCTRGDAMRALFRSGFVSLADMRAECSSKGQWESALPICRLHECPPAWLQLVIFPRCVVIAFVFVLLLFCVGFVQLLFGFCLFIFGFLMLLLSAQSKTSDW